jgi:hypothetical protein
LRSLGLNVAVITRLSDQDRAVLLGGLEATGINVAGHHVKPMD